MLCKTYIIMEIIKFLRSIHYGNREFLGFEYNKLPKVKISEKSFNRYLVDWKKEGLIYSAGRGWYSDIPEEFVLYTEPLVELNAFLAKAFPLFTFVC